MSDNNKLIELISQISRSFKEQMSLTHQTSHLTMLQLEALIFLRQQPHIQMKDMAHKFKVKMSTATSLLDRLVIGKLVLRKEDLKDRRIVRLTLTKKGEKLIDNAIKERRIIMNDVLSYVSKKDKQSLIKILNSILTRIEHKYEATA